MTPPTASPSRHPLAILVVAALLACRAGAADPRPNILFITTDQQHAGMMSCTGNRDLKTPALDQLSAAGVRFERAYASNPICLPSRFSMQTGRMPSVVGIRANTAGSEVPESISSNSLGPLLRRAGYDCAYGGKVHLPKAMTKHIFRHGYENLTPDSRDDLATVCATFIRKPRERPFFLFASFINPHDICFMAINDLARSQGKPAHRSRDSSTAEMILDEARNSPDLATFIRENCPPLPANFEVPDDEPECISTHYIGARPFRGHARTEWSGDMWRLHRWLYARLTERVDAQVGEVLKALKDAGLEEDTLVIFTSDHGDMDGAHRLEHKGVLYEESARIPLVVSWKGKFPAGRVDDTHLISNGLDLLPTLCNYAAAATPADLPGRSLRSILEGDQATEWRDHLVVESQNGRMLRTGDLKYSIYDCGKHAELLVDLRKDPGEMTNLAATPGLHDQLLHHRKLLKAWVVRHDDKIASAYVR